MDVDRVASWDDILWCLRREMCFLGWAFGMDLDDKMCLIFFFSCVEGRYG